MSGTIASHCRCLNLLMQLSSDMQPPYAELLHPCTVSRHWVYPLWDQQPTPHITCSQSEGWVENFYFSNIFSAELTCIPISKEQHCLQQSSILTHTIVHAICSQQLLKTVTVLVKPHSFPPPNPDFWHIFSHLCTVTDININSTSHTCQLDYLPYSYFLRPVD